MTTPPVYKISKVTDPAQISAALDQLRAARRDALAAYGSPEGLQAEAVAALAAVARDWLEPDNQARQWLRDDSAPFSYEETWPSLEALCLSMTEDPLWELIDREGVRGALGPEVIGHVIAGNTPLLAWTSAARALLIGSASLLKCPSGGVSTWSLALFESLRIKTPLLGNLILPLVWPSSETECTRVLCAEADTMVAYGSDETMRALRAFLPPGHALLDYGHRISCAIVAQGADYEHSAQGIAHDVWVFDQGGCLSPQCVFVEGGPEEAAQFARRLAAALSMLPRKARTPEQAATIGEQRLLARMNDGIMLHEGAGFSWTVCITSGQDFHANEAPMFVYVVPGYFLGMIRRIRKWAGHLQGISLSTNSGEQRERWMHQLQAIGLTHIVKPGRMQCPPFHWRENGRDVLRSLLA